MKKAGKSAKATKTAEAAKARRAARMTKSSRTAQTALVAAIGAGILMQGGQASHGADAPAEMSVHHVALAAALGDDDGSDAAGTTTDGESDTSGSSTSESGTSESSGGESSGGDQTDEHGTTGSAGSSTGGGDAPSSTEPAAGQPEPVSPTTTKNNGGSAAGGAAAGTKPTPKPSATQAAAPAQAGPAPTVTVTATPPQTPATTPAAGLPGKPGATTSPTAATASRTSTVGGGTTARRHEATPTRTTSPTPTGQQNVITQLALTLVGIGPNSAGGSSAPSSVPTAALVAQWALFRRSQNPLFNQSPIARPGQTGQATNGLVTGNVNATDPDGDRLTYTVTRQPTNGTVTITPTGSYTYTPNAALAQTGGTDSFTITIRDNTPTAPGLGRFTTLAHNALAVRQPALADRLFGAHSITVTVPVTVAPGTVNTPPAATNPPTTGTPDATSGAVSGNLGVTDPNGDPLTYTNTGPGTTQPTKGTVIVDPATGNYTYTPTADARHAAAADGATAADKTDTFTVLVSDGHGGTTPVTVNVPVSPANTAPAATTAPTTGTPEPATGAVTGNLGVTDPNGDPLTYSTTGPGTTQATKGTVTIDPATGNYTYTPSADARHNAAATGATAADRTDTFTVLVSDGHGGSTPVTVTVQVSPTNTAPSGPTTPPASTTNPTTGTVTGNLGVTDPNGDPLTYSTTGPGTTAPTKGTVTVDAAGNYTYTPTADARHNAAATGATAADKTDTFTVLVSDGHGGSTPVTVTVEVSPANTAPTGPTTPPASTTNPTTGAVSGSIGADDGDGDTLSYSGPTGPTSKGGTVTVDPTTGTFTYTPSDATRHAAAAAGATPADKADSFAVLVSDGHGGTVSVPVTVQIGPANNAPTAPATPPASTTNPNTGVVTGNVGVSDTDRDPLSYTTTTGPTKGSVTVDPATGNYVYTPTAAARHAAAADGATAADKTDTFTVLVSDGHGGTVSVPVTVDIRPANALPVRSSSPQAQVDRTTGVVTGTLVVADADGDQLSYSAPTTTATGGTVTIDPTTGSHTYTPTQQARQAATSGGPTTDSFTVTVNDGHGGTVQLPVTVSVAPTTIRLSFTPETADLNAQGNRLYLLHYSSTSYVVAIDPVTGQEVGPRFAADSYSYGAALSPGGDRLYVPQFDVGNIIVFDTATGQRVGAPIAVGGLPADVTVSPAGDRLYVTDFTNKVTVIDAATGQAVGAPIVVGQSRSLGGSAVSPDGRFLYVTDIDRGTLTVIDTTTRQKVGSPIDVGYSALGVAISPDGKSAYVVNNSSNTSTGTLTVVDLTTGQKVGQPIPVGDVPRSVAVTPDGKYAYVAIQGNATVAVVPLPPTGSASAGGLVLT